MLEKNKLNTVDRPVDIDKIPEPVHPTKTTKVINKLVISSLVVAALALGIILRWSFQDTSILEVHNSPFPARIVSDPSGETGGIVFLKADYCKNSSIEGTIRVSYVSKSREIFLPISPEKLPKGCQNIEVPIVIPKDLPLDTYKIKFHSVYDVNPLKQNIASDFESKEFQAGKKLN